MIKKLNEDTSLKFKTISPEEKSKKGILGRLYGNVASFAAPTRNGRHYSQELWQKLFDSPLIKERFANGGIFGELCHPDYEDVNMEKVAVVMPEPPVKDNKGNLVAYVDIVDTPCGRIAYQLAKYGYKFGISSRGSGDIIEDYNGNEEVDPDTYQLNAFDLVEIPAVESARLQFVESLDTKKRYGKTLKEELVNELNKASEEDKKIMSESLKNLDIKLDEKLVEPSEEDLAPIEAKFAELGLEVERKGETLFGNKHYQLRKELDHDVTKEDLGPIFDALCDLDSRDMPTVCSVGVHRDGDNIISASLDVLKKQVNEDLEDEDGWGEEISDRLEPIFSKLEDLMYEVRNCRRGSYDDFGDSLSGLISRVDRLSDELSDAAGYFERNEDRLNEKNESVSEDGCSNKEDQVVEEDAGNAGEDLMKELQDALSKNGELEKDNLSLQEKLSVCNAKEIKLTEELNKYKKVSSNLSGTAKRVKSLEEDLEKLSSQLEYKDKLIESKNDRLSKLIAFKKENIDKLTESETKISDLENQVKVLTESASNSDKKLSDATTLIKKYQRALKESKDRYVEAKADACGLSVDSIKAQLKESYNYKDIDSVCEALVEHKANMSKLPFRLNEDTQFKVKPSKNEYIRGNNKLSDDDVSDYLLSMIK